MVSGHGMPRPNLDLIHPTVWSCSFCSMKYNVSPSTWSWGERLTRVELLWPLCCACMCNQQARVEIFFLFFFKGLHFAAWLDLKTHYYNQLCDVWAKFGKFYLKAAPHFVAADTSHHTDIQNICTPCFTLQLRQCKKFSPIIKEPFVSLCLSLILIISAAAAWRQHGCSRAGWNPRHTHRPFFGCAAATSWLSSWISSAEDGHADGMAEHLRPQCFCSGRNVWGCPHILTHTHKHVHIHWVAPREFGMTRFTVRHIIPTAAEEAVATRHKAIRWMRTQEDPLEVSCGCAGLAGRQCLFMEAAGGIDTSHVWINAATHLWRSALWATGKLLQSIFLQAICDQQASFFDILELGQFVMQDQLTLV